MNGLDQQRVAGWLALTLQHDGGPLDGSRVSYVVAGQGCVVVTWRGGPTAAEVETLLLAAADPDVPVTRIEIPGEGLTGAVVVVGGVRVALHAVEPRSRRGPRDPIRALPTWQAPNPMRDDGHAVDVVVWEVQPDPGGVGVAVVHRSPTSVLEDDDYWSDGVVVAHLGFQPSPTAHYARLTRWKHAHEIAEVHYRAAAPGWSDADADRWLTQMFHHSTTRPAPCTAVVWHDRCLMRLRRADLRVDARFETSPHMIGMASRVPSVVQCALRRAPDGETVTLPDTLIISKLGHGGHDSQRYRVRLHTSITVPNV